MGGPMAQETYSVWCVNRHHMDGSFDKAATVERWNTRASVTADPRVSALEAALRVARGYIIEATKYGSVLGTDRMVSTDLATVDAALAGSAAQTAGTPPQEAV